MTTKPQEQRTKSTAEYAPKGHRLLVQLIPDKGKSNPSEQEAIAWAKRVFGKGVIAVAGHVDNDGRYRGSGWMLFVPGTPFRMNGTRDDVPRAVAAAQRVVPMRVSDIG